MKGFKFLINTLVTLALLQAALAVTASTAFESADCVASPGIG